MSTSEQLEKPALPWTSIIIAGFLIVIVAVIFFWPVEEQPVATDTTQTVEPEMVPEVTSPEQPQPASPVIDDELVKAEEEMEQRPEADDVVDIMQPPEPEPQVTESLPSGNDDELVAALENVTLDAVQGQIQQLLANDDLVNRFVVSVENIANQQLAPNHRVAQPPEEKFRVYQQAKRTWIDAKTFERYDPYVNLLEGMNNEQLIGMYRAYLPLLEQKYAEVGRGDRNFEFALTEAIDHILATPEVNTPIEVETDSVMYKFVKPELEALSSVQKQLIRMGPENSRRVKQKLRELKQYLQQ